MHIVNLFFMHIVMKIRFFLPLFGLLLIVSCVSRKPSGGRQAILLEEPKYSETEYIIRHSGFEISYDEQKLVPKWVAWELSDNECRGKFKRADVFTPDPEWKGLQADDRDYRGSGWSRGHMAPAGDMKWSEQSMLESFYLTNVCPQNSSLNSGCWNAIEEMCRRMALRHGSAWICCGPLFDGQEYRTIGADGVAVPDSFFKVVLVSDDNGYHSIGFICRNKGGHMEMEDCCMSVDDVEKITGMDFFPSLPDKVEEATESICDFSYWN